MLGNVGLLLRGLKTGLESTATGWITIAFIFKTHTRTQMVLMCNNIKMSWSVLLFFLALASQHINISASKLTCLYVKKQRGIKWTRITGPLCVCSFSKIWELDLQSLPQDYGAHKDAVGRCGKGGEGGSWQREEKRAEWRGLVRAEKSPTTALRLAHTLGHARYLCPQAGKIVLIIIWIKILLAKNWSETKYLYSFQPQCLIFCDSACCQKFL